jgi:hypothetical protein
VVGTEVSRLTTIYLSLDDEGDLGVREDAGAFFGNLLLMTGSGVFGGMGASRCWVSLRLLLEHYLREMLGI